MKKNIGITFQGILAFIDTCKDSDWDNGSIVDELVAFCEKKVNQQDRRLYEGAHAYQEHDNCIALIDGLVRQECKDECDGCQADWCHRCE